MLVGFPGSTSGAKDTFGASRMLSLGGHRRFRRDVQARHLAVGQKLRYLFGVEKTLPR